MIFTWQEAFLRGVAPQFSARSLTAMLAALERDDRALIQNATVRPSPLSGLSQDVPCNHTCAIGYLAQTEYNLATNSQVLDAFGLALYQADVYLGEVSAVRFFLNWYDDTPRDQMRAALAETIRGELDSRALRGSVPVVLC